MNKDKLNTDMNRYTKVMIAFLVLAALSVGPSIKLPGYWWIFPPLILWLLAMIAAFRVEKLKKDAGIRHVSEIAVFSENANSNFLRRIFRFDEHINAILIVMIVCILVVLMVAGSVLVFSL